MRSAASSTSSRAGGWHLRLLAVLAIACAALVAAAGAGAATDPNFGTATTVSLSSSSIAAGGSVTMTATVTGVGAISSLLAPTGTVQFSRISGDGTTTPIGVATLFAVSATESRASLTTSSIPSGSYSVVAFYTSDDPFSFFGSDSTASPQTLVVGAVTFHNTHTVLTAAPSPANVGDTVLLTATVTRDDGSGIPTGVVRFSDTTGGGDTWIADVPLVGGVATYPDSSLSAGTHELLASYIGQFFDTSSGGKFTLTVQQPKQVEVATTTTLTANPATIRSDKSVTLTAHVVQSGTPTPPPGGGVVTFVGNGVTLGTGIVDANGDAVLVKGGWAGGDYTLLATYVGNIYDGVAYHTSAGGGTLKVTDALETTTKYDGPLSAQRGDSVPLSATLTAKATGAALGSKLVTLSLGSLTCSATTDAAGHATCSVVADLPAGSYPLSATFDGDDVYVQSSDTMLFPVTLRPTSLAYDGDTTAASGHAATLSATLADTTGPVSGKTVTLTLNGQPSESCSGATDANGRVSCQVTVSEAAGSYPIAAGFAGDATYAASTASAQMQVTAEIPTRLTYSGDAAAAWGAPATIAFTLTQNDGTPVSDKTVSLTIDGHTASATTDGSGRAALPVTAPATPGPYTVSGAFAGDADYLAAGGSGALTVQKHATTLTYAATSPTTIGQPATLSATLRDANGSLLAGEPVTLSLQDGGSCSSTTVSGVAACTVTANAPAGSRTLAASFAGDSLYLPSAGSGSLAVAKIATSVSYAGDTEARSGATATLAAILKDANGQPVAGKTLTLAFSPSGSCTTGSTDANGYASCPLVVGGATGAHDVTASFGGDDTYAGSSGDGTLTITTIPTTLVYDGATQVVTGNAATLGATLKDVFGNALSGRTVTFSLSSGDTCSAQTDDSGHASCKPTVTRDAADYTVTASFAESLPYLASSDEEPFKVLRAPTSLASADATVVTGRSVTLTATLRDQFGQLFSGKSVTLTVPGYPSCTQTTVAGAISCPFTIDKPAGDYQVAVSFAGDARNLPIDAAAKLTVQKAGTIVTLATTKPAQQGGPATLQATLKRADTNAPVVGRQLTLSLGAQSCTTTATGGDGAASCTIPAVTVALGPQPTAASFGGDGYYLDSSAAGSTFVYALAPGGGAFVVGDQTASGNVTFWGSRWWKVNELSGGDPAQFKGFALNVPSTVCGAPWSTDPGNSPPPPGALPAYMGVIVTSSNGKDAPNVHGNIAGLVIVKTDAGYAGNPGNDGTGTVVAGPFCP